MQIAPRERSIRQADRRDVFAADGARPSRAQALADGRWNVTVSIHENQYNGIHQQ